MIDIHSHLAYHKVYSPAYLRGMIESSGQIQPEKIDLFLKALLRDKDGSQHVAQMDKSGIDKSVLLIIDSAVGMEPPALTIEEIYEVHFNVLKQWPDRFIVFAGIDPRRGEQAYDLFLKGVESFGFRGLKLYPPMGYAMDHPYLEKIYEYCDTHRLPVLIHTGNSLDVLDKEFSKVKNAIDVVRRYPNITFILAHSGYQLDNPGMEELLLSNNVFFDLAGIQVLLGNTQDEMSPGMTEENVNRFCDKLVFGSDWPLFNLLTPMQDHLLATRKLLAGYRLSELQINTILNSRHLEPLLSR